MIGTHLEDCKNRDAHNLLEDFNERYKSWKSEGAASTREDIRQQLTYFRATGEGQVIGKEAGKADPLDTKCKRFLLKASGTLSSTADEFRVLHDNFWDTWGFIVGHLLKKEPNEATADAKTILSNLRIYFKSNFLHHRHRTMKGFKEMVRLSSGYEDEIMDIFNYFCSYNEAACSGILGELPGSMCDCTNWLVESYLNLAEKISEEKLGGGCASSISHKMIDSAGTLMELIARANGSADFGTDGAVSMWNTAMLQWIFYEQNIRKNTIVVKRRVKFALDKLVKRLKDIRDTSAYEEMYYKITPSIQGCDTINQRVIYEEED